MGFPCLISRVQGRKSMSSAPLVMRIQTVQIVGLTVDGLQPKITGIRRPTISFQRLKSMVANLSVTIHLMTAFQLVGIAHVTIFPAMFFFLDISSNVSCKKGGQRLVQHEFMKCEHYKVGNHQECPYYSRESPTGNQNIYYLHIKILHNMFS